MTKVNVKHQYCCQNMVQDYHDHIISVPDDFNVNPDCLYGISKTAFISGLKLLTEILKSMYADMIQNPAEYGLPLVDDIEYSPFNPKAANSINSAHRLVSLLHSISQCGELEDGKIVVNKKQLSTVTPKSIYKVSNANMLYKKLGEHGFEIDGFNGKTLERKRDEFSLSYLDNAHVIPSLYGFMRNTPLQKSALFSLNYFLAIKEEELPSNNHQLIFAQYLSGDEQKFFTHFDEYMTEAGLVVGNKGDYGVRQFRIEYLLKPKDGKCLVRCYSDFGKLRIFLRLRRLDRYADYLESLPERVKQIFRVDSNCRFCQDNCGYQNAWTFEGVSYTLCGYMQYFEITDFNIDDIVYYTQIIAKEIESSKIKR